MKRALRVPLVVSQLVVVLSASSCFAVSRIGRFSEGEEAADGGVDAAEAGAADDPSKPSSLRFTMRDMGVHFNQLIEFRVIDNQNTIQTRGIINPLDDLGTVSITVNVPNAIPLDNRPYRLDFYGDMNKSGTYDGIGDVLKQDHAWRVSPLVDSPADSFPHVANLTQVVFEHTKVMTDIDQWPLGTANPAKATGLDAVVHFSGARIGSYAGKLLEVRIAESRTLRTVGFFRQPKIQASDLDAVMRGVLEPEVSYNVDVYVDANGNGIYDNPAMQASDVDLGWRLPIKAELADAGAQDASADAGTPPGIFVDFDPRGAYPNNVDVGEP